MLPRSQNHNDDELLVQTFVEQTKEPPVPKYGSQFEYGFESHTRHCQARIREDTGQGSFSCEGTP